MYINKYGYVERKTTSQTSKGGQNRATRRSWWLVNHYKIINIGRLSIPKEYLGKRIRLKVEVDD